MSRYGIILIKVGENIKRCREMRNMTQQELSDRIFLTRGSIANMERGNQNIDIERLYKIADALQVDISQLLPPRSHDQATAEAFMYECSVLIEQYKHKVEKAKLLIDSLQDTLK